MINKRRDDLNLGPLVNKNPNIMFNYRFSLKFKPLELGYCHTSISKRLVANTIIH